jgi:hypothetical protein
VSEAFGRIGKQHDEAVFSPREVQHREVHRGMVRLPGQAIVEEVRDTGPAPRGLADVVLDRG